MSQEPSTSLPVLDYVDAAKTPSTKCFRIGLWLVLIGLATISIMLPKTVGPWSRRLDWVQEHNERVVTLIVVQMLLYLASGMVTVAGTVWSDTRSRVRVAIVLLLILVGVGMIGLEVVTAMNTFWMGDLFSNQGQRGIFEP